MSVLNIWLAGSIITCPFIHSRMIEYCFTNDFSFFVSEPNRQDTPMQTGEIVMDIQSGPKMDCFRELITLWHLVWKKACNISKVFKFCLQKIVHAHQCI